MSLFCCSNLFKDSVLIIKKRPCPVTVPVASQTFAMPGYGQLLFEQKGRGCSRSCFCYILLKKHFVERSLKTVQPVEDLRFSCQLAQMKTLET